MVFAGLVHGGVGGIGTSGTSQRVVVKIPTIRHWGFRFYRVELDSLLAVRREVDSAAPKRRG